jgi:threonyl-tRNA synthetase
LERVSMVLTEHFAGAFPTWLAPDQVMLIPIADKHNEYVQELKNKLIAEGIRSKSDLRSERMNYKIRDAQEKQIPYMLIIGDKEMENNKVNVRHRRSDSQTEMSVNDFIEKINQEIKTRAL